MPKLRTDPTEFAHLCLSTLEGSTGAIDETFYAGRRVDFRSATMMLLDVAPPDFAVVDAWAPVADGPFGVMGCRRPGRRPARLRGSRRAGRRRGGARPISAWPIRRRRPIVAGRPTTGSGWTGAPASVDGDRPPLGAELRGAHASALLRGLGTVSYPDLHVSQQPRRAFRARHGHRGISSARASRRRHARGAVAEPAGVRPAHSGAARLMRLDPAPSCAGSCRPVRAGHAPARGARDQRQPRPGPVAVPGLGRPARRARRSLATRAARGLSHETRRHAHRPARAWLDVGAERRASSLGAPGRVPATGPPGAGDRGRGSACSSAHYRSMLDYQTGPYEDLASSCAARRARVATTSTATPRHRRGSLAAAPFVLPFLREVAVASTRARARSRLRHRGVPAGPARGRAPVPPAWASTSPPT